MNRKRPDRLRPYIIHAAICLPVLLILALTGNMLSGFFSSPRLLGICGAFVLG